MAVNNNHKLILSDSSREDPPKYQENVTFVVTLFWYFSCHGSKKQNSTTVFQFFLKYFQIFQIDSTKKRVTKTWHNLTKKFFKQSKHIAVYLNCVNHGAETSWRYYSHTRFKYSPLHIILVHPGAVAPPPPPESSIREWNKVKSFIINCKVNILQTQTWNVSEKGLQTRAPFMRFRL